MNCSYTYKGNSYSYKELIDVLQINESEVHDLLYSKDLDLQIKIAQKVNTLKDLGKKISFSKDVDILSGSADLISRDNMYTARQFIDSSIYKKKDGTPVMPPINVENFLNNMKIVYTNQGMSEEEIAQKLSVIKYNWEKIAEDCRDLHKILLNIDHTTTQSQIRDLVKDSKSFSLLNDILEETEKKVYGMVRRKHRTVSKELNDTSTPIIIKNINFSAKLADFDKTVVCHVDYLVINPNGSIEIFNIKGSHEPETSWDKAKIEKYTHEFAILSRILEYNGINVTGAKFNIIPVILEYDQQYKNIVNLSVQNTVCLSHKKDKFVMEESCKIANMYIDSTVDEINIDTESIDKVNTQLRAFVPHKDIKAKGITLTAEEYVDKNWAYLICGKQPERGYNIRLGGIDYTISDPERGSKNKEIVDLVKLHQNELLHSGRFDAHHIITALENSRRSGYVSLDNEYLSEYFKQYFDRRVISVNGKKEYKYKYKWSIVKNNVLNDANILLFKNNDTGQLNIVVLSALNLNIVNDYNGNSRILNYHMPDVDAFDNQGRMLLKATYGNLELMRTMFLLNEILPQIQNFTLGDIQVIGGIGTSINTQSYPMALVLSNFTKAVQVLTQKDPLLDLQNNFTKIGFTDPVKILINEYENIMVESSNIDSLGLQDIKDIILGSDESKLIRTIDGSSVDSLASAKTNEVRIQRLTELINKLQSIILEKGGGIPLTPQVIHDKAKEFDKRKLSNETPTYTQYLIPTCCKLLEESLLILNRLTGNVRLIETELTSDVKYFTRPQDSNNPQIKLVGKLLTDSINAISKKLDDEISDFNLACLKYYEKKGYSKTENFFIGDQSKIFKHLFQDLDNELLFKNPFDMTNGLDSDDREFLKIVIHHINKRRPFKTDASYPYKSHKDPELESFIERNPESLYVPLEPASQSTKWTNPEQYFKDFKRNVQHFVKNPKLLFQEMYEGWLEENDMETVNRYVRDLQVYNKFKASEVPNGRQRLLNRGKEFFETNLQNLIIDYTYRDIAEKELNNMLIKAKGVLLYIRMTGDQNIEDVEKYNDLEKHINDYLKVSVFNQSIMREDTKKLIARIQPLRKAFTTLSVALNPAGAVRDLIAGLRSNLVRSITGYQTDVDASDVLWAYQYVLRNGQNSTMTINLLDKFNTKYLISNINREEMQEAHKTNREGISNVGNLMYWTLKKPDFINRMVLFMAKLKHDGSHKAYQIINDQLVYNWRNDDRFNLLATNNKSNIEAYNEQKSLYLSTIIKFNEENPNLKLPVSLEETDLPDAYTMQEIESIKLLGDTIYGSYHKSTKAMYEHMAIGSQLGFFTTWFNGIYTAYFGRTRESSFEITKVQATDESGNLLWIDEDGNITTNETGVKYTKDIPLVVQGVVGTLWDVFKILYHTEDGKWDALKTKIWNSVVQRRNIKRFLSDLIYCMLIYLLLKPWLTEEYKEHKKTTDPDNLATNIAIEWLFKGYIGSLDEMTGPVPIFDYVLNNTSPASFRWANRTVEDIIDLTFGNKTLGEFAFGLSAFTRSMQDSYKLYQKSLNE